MQGAHRAVRTERQLATAGVDPDQIHTALRVTPLEPAAWQVGAAAVLMLAATSAVLLLGVHL